jgi:hypothetical protein
MAWLLLVDTSRRTDYLLVLTITCIDAVLALYVAIVAGLGPAAAALVVLLAALVASTWYARIMWRREEAGKKATTPAAVKIRRAR